MAYTVAICSLKGGVGKTTVTLGLASASIAAGIPTRVLDLDPQADTTLSLGAMRSDDDANIRGLLFNPSPADLDNRAIETHWDADSLSIVPGSTSLAEIDYPYPSEDDAQRLYGMTHADASSHDGLTLIDCPPSLGTLTARGLIMSDRAIIVTEPGLFSVNAVGRALAAINDLRTTLAPKLQPLGVIINRNMPRGLEQRYRVEELRRIFGPLILSPVLDERAALQQAQGAGSRIHDWPGTVSRELDSAFDAIFARMLRATA